jgi:hypothetical protein
MTAQWRQNKYTCMVSITKVLLIRFWKSLLIDSTI